jgi:hypothetical protein
VDVLERIFLVLAYGIKYLEKEVVNDFRKFCFEFIKMFFLFANTQVRKISGEALSYLVKKVSLNKEEFFRTRRLGYVNNCSRLASRD